MTCRVLVIGSNGQVGHELMMRARTFPALTVIGLTRAQLDLVHADRIAPALDIAQPDIVINAAAWTAVDRAETEQAAAFAINGDAVAVLAEHCTQRTIPLLHLSTDYVFDGSGTRPWLASDSPAPLGTYGRSKLAGEMAARRCPQHLVLRTSWVFGAHGNNFVRTMVRLAGERDRLRVVADQIGGPTWAGHLADALLTLAERHAHGEALPWGLYHYAGQPWVSWHQFATETLTEAHRLGLIEQLPTIEAISTAEYPLPAPRPLNSRLDMQDTTRALGLSAPNWRDGLQQVLREWHATP